jgi:hypothetical protein
VITEIDESIKQVLDGVLGRGEVELVFDAPTTDWAARRSGPTIDAFLYDIREDVRRRENGVIERRSEDGTVSTRSRPARYFKLSYLLTAWVQRPEDEHRLLDRLLASFDRLDALPADTLTGSLADIASPVPVSIALPPPEDRAFADVWSSLGGELKPSLDLVVIAPSLADVALPFGPPVLQQPASEIRALDGSVVERLDRPLRRAR